VDDGVGPLSESADVEDISAGAAFKLHEASDTQAAVRLGRTIKWPDQHMAGKETSRRLFSARLFFLFSPHSPDGQEEFSSSSRQYGLVRK
jgi:hypothetical protein